MRKFGLAAFFICLLSVSVFADIYAIPEALVLDVREKKAALEAHPTSNEARFELAMSYAYTGQIRLGWGTLKTLPKSYSQEVVATYEGLTSEHLSEWTYPFKLGFGYFFVKKKQEALDAFYEARKRNPDNVWILAFIALIKGEMGHVDEAIKICKQALKMEPNATGVHFLLGEGYRKKGKYIPFLSEMMIVGRLETEEALMRKE
jgi:tetratricopeptide (TPR) repeat protein